MASEPDPDRLQALEKKLQKVKGKEPPPQDQHGQGFLAGRGGLEDGDRAGDRHRCWDCHRLRAGRAVRHAADLPDHLLALRLRRRHQDDARLGEGNWRRKAEEAAKDEGN